MQPTVSSNKSVSHPAVFSGALGIVIMPDKETIQQAYALAAEILPPTSEYVLAAGSIPHLTLYHGKLNEVPVDEALRIVSDIREILSGIRFSLGPIVAYGGNFVFWNVEKNSQAGLLGEAHIKALLIAQFLDGTSEVKATSEECLALSQTELDNVKQYGHPLVKQLYSPHITLGFNPGISQQLVSGLHKKVEFSVDSVELVTVGYPGRVESIINLEKAI